MTIRKRFHRSAPQQITAKMYSAGSLELGKAVRTATGYYVKHSNGGLVKIRDESVIKLLNMGNHKIEKGHCSLCGLPADNADRCYHPSRPKVFIWRCPVADQRKLEADQAQATELERQLRETIFGNNLRAWERLPFWKRWLFWKFPKPTLEMVVMPPETNV